jgi:hypothetical protein
VSLDERVETRVVPLPTVRGRVERLRNLAMHPVPVALAVAAILHLLWVTLLANSGGDIAAQDAWADFARTHPGSAYNLAWYGGMHPVSYSILSPYVMAALGVRATMIIAGTLSAGLLALLLVRSRSVQRPMWPAVYGAFALAGNAVSGRVTFGLGLLFALGCLVVVYAWPTRWRSGENRHLWPRGMLAAVLSALATACSPVAGLFLGVVAAALWLGRRRPTAYCVGLPPLAVVALSAWLFPFSGEQPMHTISTILPVAIAVAVMLLVPAAWRSVRIGAAVYAVGVLLVWVVPSPIGSNVTRLALLFGGVLLVAAVVTRAPRPVERWAGPTAVILLLAAGITTSSIWQVATAARDTITTSTPHAWEVELGPLVDQLESRHAELARVEVVPTSSHREAAALAPYANLARGWNRQADAERNPIFYSDEPLTPAAYREWLDRWAVHYVVLPASRPDAAAVDEAELVSAGLRYLRPVWSNPSWRLFEVRNPTPLADPPAVVTSFDAAEVVLYMPRAGTVTVRIPDSPWLSLLDDAGRPVDMPTEAASGAPPVNAEGCLSELPLADDGETPGDHWTVLHAPGPGTYRIAAPYKLPRGTTCPEP